MKKVGIPTLAIATVLYSGAIVLPTAPAFAQPGSRLCGYTANTTATAYGFLYEVRQASASYKSDCDSAMHDISKAIKGNEQLKNLNWQTHNEDTCEEVGGLFLSQNSPQDMCDKMEANQHYSVTRVKSTNSTTYLKTGGSVSSSCAPIGTVMPLC